MPWALIRARSAAARSTQASYSKSYSKLFGRVNVGYRHGGKSPVAQLLRYDFFMAMRALSHVRIRPSATKRRKTCFA